MVDGCALLTVEGLGAGGLADIQRAMVEEHGAQCGFCTPGIVMALHAHHARGGAAEPAALCDALAGNLCRCTGYGPILRAGERTCRLPGPALPAQPSPAPIDLGYAIRSGTHTRRFHAPATLDELARLTHLYPDAVILAGATDVGLWVTKQGRQLETLISVMRVAELQVLAETGAGLEIGAAVRYADALEALAGLHPCLRDYVRRIGAMQVRDSGTVVGNIANGSPIGDMPPVLIALGASIRLRSGATTRELPLQDFFLAYGKQDREKGEIVTHVIIPRPSADAFVAAEKISKRFEQDISAVSGGFFVRVHAARVVEVRLAFGGMAGVPKRAAMAEEALLGAAWTEASIELACDRLAEDFAPLSDWRSSAEYRLDSARGALLRFFREQANPTAAPRLSALRSVAHG
jgi:xanthine dehydrogenase small subunit